VYSRVTSKFHPQNIKDLAIRDFYPIITNDDELDSRMEDVLGHIEGQAALIFKGLLSSLNPLRVLSEQQAADLAVFICFQMGPEVGESKKLRQAGTRRRNCAAKSRTSSCGRSC
jgi:hypothetical protein